jgi:hypothetical protein
LGEGLLREANAKTAMIRTLILSTIVAVPALVRAQEAPEAAAWPHQASDSSRSPNPERTHG